MDLDKFTGNIIDLIQSDDDIIKKESQDIFFSMKNRIKDFIEFSKGSGDMKTFVEENRVIYGRNFSYEDAKISMMLGDEDKKNLKLNKDSQLVKAPRIYLNQYQNDKTKDKSTIKCRQCLPGFTFVIVINDRQEREFKTIKSLYLKNYRGKILYNKDGEYAVARVLDVWNSGKKDILEIETVTGQKLKCSTLHKVWLPQKKMFICANLLKNDDFLNVYYEKNSINSKIKKIKKSKKENTYDLSISDKDYHNFYANGILVSNSEMTENEINENIYLSVSRPYTNVRHIFPTSGMAQKISKEKISVAIEKSPNLAIHLKRPYNLLSKAFKNGSFYTIDSSWTDYQGRGPSSDKLTFDEYESQNPQIEDIFSESTSHSELGKKTRISTPVFPNSGIDLMFQKGCGYTWHITCPNPKCKKEQILEFPDNIINFFEIGGGISTVSENYLKKLNKVYLGCKFCGAYIDRTTQVYIKNSRWIPERPHLIHDRASYRITYMMLPWKTGKEILYKYHTFRFVHQFWNEIMGYAYLDKESQITREIFEQCIDPSFVNTYQRLGNAKNVSVGIDWGTVSWVTVVANNFLPEQKNPKVIYVEKIDDESLKKNGYSAAQQTDHAKRVCDIIKFFKARIVVNDANGIGVDRNSYLVRKFPTRAYGCFYDTDERKKQKAKKNLIKPMWNEGQKTVTVSRVGSFKNLLQRFEEKQLKIPKLDPSVEEFIQHLANLVVERYEDENTGALYEVIGKTGPDHLGHSTNYALIGFEKIVNIDRENSGSGIITNPNKINEDILKQLKKVQQPY